MTSLFERLDTEEAIVRGELSVLREKIAVAEERLTHLTITRETLRSLMGEEGDAEDNSTAPPPQEPSPPDSQNPSDGSASEAAPDDASDSGNTPGSSGPLELAVARERMLVLLAGAGRAMKVQVRSLGFGTVV
ncbi:hypothetical protein OG264_38390 [Streptomyces xanthophaeus]|uniref:hypothetical protein n=1 Tax=Streptomyces xanthophaeus TaxID=67385 RepID=UPI003869D118|nr:hypothetical protein OG264_38390 [Streptomyces xanthophaeus]WST58168.1 hypothetical protein OG605_00045 [Streptomyces xanthophaeus]